MKSCSYGEPDGRKIGQIGNYTLYSNKLAAEKYKTIHNTLKATNNAFNFVYGPSTGGLIESTQFNVLTNGESIKGMAADPMFKKRYLKVIGLNVENALPIIERINGTFSASHSIAFLSAVENAVEIDLDRQINMGRIIELELERIRNHLHVGARICEAAAFGVPYNNLFYLREKINRIIEEYSGHRFFYGANIIGGININFQGVSNSLDGMYEEIHDIYESLCESKIFVDRLMDNGVVTDPDCLGPVLRGCGHPYDARVDSNTLPYDELDFSPVVETEGNGDVMDRFIVRFEEIFKSFQIINAAEKGHESSRVRDFSVHEFNGEGLSRVESPSGDLAYLIQLDEGTIKEINMLTSSKVNLPIFLESTVGNVFTDFHFNWESFGIWISEIAVEFV